MTFSGHDDSTINIVLGLLLLLLLLVTQVELILVEFWITAVCLEFVDSKHTHNMPGALLLSTVPQYDHFVQGGHMALKVLESP